MSIFYKACVDFQNLGIALKKLSYIKDINKDYIYASQEIIWKHGNYMLDQELKPSFFHRNKIHTNLDKAIEDLYIQLEKVFEILEIRKQNTLENVKLAEEILQDEKKEAKEASSKHKKYLNMFKNLDITNQLRKRGIQE